MTKKEKRQSYLLQVLSLGPCEKSKLINQLKISERTLWRDKKDLATKGYAIKIADSRVLLTEVSADLATDKDVRRLAILKFVAEAPLSRKVLKTKIARSEGCNPSTVDKDISDLIDGKYLAIDNNKLTLGEAMLGGLELSQEEGSRLLSYLVVRQQIEGKNALYNTLLHTLINSMGKNSWFSWQQAKRTTQRICIKGKQVEQEMRERAMAERLELASWEEQVVELIYREEKRQVEPLGVIYSYHQDAWYLHAFCRKAKARRTFRLEQIQEFRILEEKFAYPPDFDLEESFALSWGIMVDEPPVKVQIKFYDDFNVISRLRREVADRKQAKLTPMEDGTILYEDWVVGMEEFKVWIRSFGSSAEILEPIELRENLLASVKAALARYGEVGS